MADPEDPGASRTSDVRRLSSGYDPEAGLAAHQADAPTRIPVPSLLRALLTDHLDPGYAAAAERRGAGQGRGRVGEWGWQLLAVVLIAAVFAAAAAHARSAASGTEQTQQALVSSVRTAEATAEDVTARRDALAGAVDDQRRNRLEGDERGRELLGRLDEANFSAAVTPVIGPGLTVTVTDPGASNDLSDVSQQRVAGSPQVILDRDLQLVVNSLWASGAEALAVDGVRIGPNVTIRQAGGGILVDNHPITSPYEIIAIGPPDAMRDVFEGTPGLHRLRLLETAYGAGATVSTGEGLMAPAGSVREVNFATEFDP